MALKIGKTTEIENLIEIKEVKIIADYRCKTFTYRKKTVYAVPENIMLCKIILKYKCNGEWWKSSFHYFLKDDNEWGCYTRDRLFKKQKEIIKNDIYNNIQSKDDIAYYKEEYIKELIGKCIFVKDC